MITTQKSTVHAQLEILRKRTTLTRDQRLEFERLRTGHEGEAFFKNLLQRHLSNRPIIFSDLRFTIKKSECQIDCLLIYRNECVLLEIKNYRSDFYIENNKWYMTDNDKEIGNPLEQTNRAKRMLTELFTEEGIRLNIKTFVIFTHSKFLLYNAPRNREIVYPNRLELFINFLNKKDDKLSGHYRVAEKLQDRKVKLSTYDVPVEFDSKKLRQGVTCLNLECSGYMKAAGRKNLKCSECAATEPFEAAIIRSIYEYSTLFL